MLELILPQCKLSAHSPKSVLPERWPRSTSGMLEPSPFSLTFSQAPPFDDTFRLPDFESIDPDLRFKSELQTLLRLSPTSVSDRFRFELLRISSLFHEMPKRLPFQALLPVKRHNPPSRLRPKEPAATGLEYFMKIKGHDSKLNELEKLLRSMTSVSSDELAPFTLSV